MRKTFSRRGEMRREALKLSSRWRKALVMCKFPHQSPSRHIMMSFKFAMFVFDECLTAARWEAATNKQNAPRSPSSLSIPQRKLGIFLGFSFYEFFIKCKFHRQIDINLQAHMVTLKIPSAEDNDAKFDGTHEISYATST